MSRFTKIAVVSLSLLIFSYVGLGYMLGKSDDDKAYRSLTVYGEVLQRVQEDYVDEPNLSNVTAGALHGLLESLDPFSGYLSAREYADFVYIRPFYEFHFAHALKQLWKETPLWGKHPIRKWERKCILSIDYGIESIYAEAMQLASHLAYGVESDSTYTWIDNSPETLFQEFPKIKNVKQVGPQSFVVIIPRYQEFTDRAVELAKRDVHFAQIAGNEEIMLTVVVPKSWNNVLPASEATLLFTENFMTQPDLKRIAFECPVRSLHSVLNRLAAAGLKIEHIYDY